MRRNTRAAVFGWTASLPYSEHPRMSRKAGPRRIDPETFRPIVLTPEGAETSFLICRRRWLRGKDVLGGPDEALFHCEHVTMPVAIQLAPKVEVLTGLKFCDIKFRASKPEDHGVPERCAKVALAEAWHGVHAILDLGTFAVHISSRMDDWTAHKKGTRIRNLILALLWDEWKREGRTIEDLAEALTNSGYPSTKRQVERFSADHGL